MSEASKDALDPKVITDLDSTQPVPEHITKVVEEGRKAGLEPIKAPKAANAMNPRAHLPQYAGKMVGELPDNHPERIRHIKEQKAARRREEERDAAVRAAEAEVEQKIQLGARVVIGSNAKVDYVDENGARIKGDYGGIEGEVYQTYLDHEGVRRYIITDRDPDTGKSKFAPVAVRECDVKELSARREGGGRRFHAVPRSPEQRAELAAQEAQRRANMTQEEVERATFGGRTAEELANLMCGL